VKHAIHRILDRPLLLAIKGLDETQRSDTRDEENGNDDDKREHDSPPSIDDRGSGGEFIAGPKIPAGGAMSHRLHRVGRLHYEGKEQVQGSRALGRRCRTRNAFIIVIAVKLAIEAIKNTLK
jgi:hypothetical protein